MDGKAIINELLETSTKEGAFKGAGKPAPKKRLRSKTKEERRREARRMFTMLHLESKERELQSSYHV